jgi:hypothetical protein
MAPPCGSGRASHTVLHLLHRTFRPSGGISALVSNRVPQDGQIITVAMVFKFAGTCPAPHLIEKAGPHAFAQID